MKKLLIILILAWPFFSQAREIDQIKQIESFKGQVQADTQLSDLIEALGKTPKNPGLHFKLAEAYRERGLLDLARVSYERTLKLKPHYPWAHVGLSLVFREKGEAPWELYHLRQAALQAPEDDQIRFKLGRLYMESKVFDYKKAKQEYKALKKMNSPLATQLGKVMELE
ncbi:MAG: hypothetical protein KDK66_00885 [Deltaproteobacteria bacterium]|nr:hypothetical protein [Deltaproteobacteria bacterium]